MKCIISCRIIGVISYINRIRANMRAVPKSIARPPYADTGAVPRSMTSLFYSLLPITSPNSGINRHTAEEIELASASAQLAANLPSAVRSLLQLDWSAELCVALVQRDGLGVAHGVGEALPLEPRGFPFEALGLLEVLCVLFPQASDVETRCGRPLDNSPAEICSGLLNVRVKR